MSEVGIMPGSRPAREIAAPVLPPGVVLDGNPARQRRQVWKYTRANYITRRWHEEMDETSRAIFYRFLADAVVKAGITKLGSRYE